MNENYYRGLDLVSAVSVMTGTFSSISEIYIFGSRRFELTVLPNTSADAWEVKALVKYFDTTHKHGLPTKPCIRLDADEASEFIIKKFKFY